MKTSTQGSWPRLLPSFLLALAACALAGVAGGAEEPVESVDPALLSRQLDELYRSDSSRGLMEMTVTTPHYERTLRMQVWSRGEDYTLVRILSPRKEEGISSLKRGREMWNYLPKIGKTIRVPPSMMMASWMGSDFTNDDLVKEYSWEDDYLVEYGEPAAPGEFTLVYRPREGAAVTWERVEIGFDRASRLPLWEDYYDEKGRKARRLEFSEVREMGGRHLPTVMTLTPLSEDKRGRVTIVHYLEMEFDLPLPEETFTLAYLRRSR